MKYIPIILALLFCQQLIAQDKKEYNIQRTEYAPVIDGKLDDKAWQEAQIGTDFIQFRPDVGKGLPDYQKTTVQITYNDDAIFIGAYLKDKPENILKQLTQRDNFGQSDFFGIIFNPNNDGQNDTEFFVFSSGTQADAIANPTVGEDFGWNAVWESAVELVDDGWIVEVKIPYSALRFSNQEDPVWGINFHRQFRKTRSQFTWNPIDPTKGNIGLYHGELKGLKDIKPPTRLSFFPFASGVLNAHDGETASDLNFGMDVKYGLTENFTLDATLIPDFSQARFDNVSLNLGPFEQQFSEQRQFFTEGIDLFTKGNLFYSRRIGSRPTGSPTLSGDEEVTNFPDKVQMLNAVKISGRTKNNLGIGFFNAITKKTSVDIKNSVTDETRSEVVEPFTNYNILVLDQQFNKNSSVGIINTNVTRLGDFRDANVTGFFLDMNNKKNTYGLFAKGNISNVREEDSNKTGFYSVFGFTKNSGQFQFTFENVIADDKYDKNDMGILFRNNFKSFNFNTNYRIFKPTKILNEFRVNLNASVLYLLNPSTYESKNFNVNWFGTLKKSLISFGGFVGIQPGEQKDFFGPRKDGYYFISEDWINSNMWVSTNFNKTFAFEANVGYETLFEEGRDYTSYFYGFRPRLKLNDKFLISYNHGFDLEKKERGYVDDIGDDIIYGQRDQKTIENSIYASYNFDSFHGLTLSVRNYWSTVTYEDDLYVLQEDGRLNQIDNYTKSDIDSPDVNYNSWFLDLGYSWQFAPGSQLTVLYRNQLFKNTNASEDTYFESLNSLFKVPLNNTFSLKMVYYIDYNNVAKRFKKK